MFAAAMLASPECARLEGWWGVGGSGLLASGPRPPPDSVPRAGMGWASASDAHALMRRVLYIVLIVGIDTQEDCYAGDIERCQEYKVEIMISMGISLFPLPLREFIYILQKRMLL